MMDLKKRRKIIVDLSWLMHRNFHAYERLSFIKNDIEVPTGHIYGTYKFLKRLSESNPDADIVLAVDSHCTYRKKIYSEYKSNRHKPDAYDIHQDTEGILKLCTHLSNVYFVKIDGYEADDIIASFMRKSDKSWQFYFRDNDILQTKGEYTLMVSFNDSSVGIPFDRKEYIKKKYDLDLDYLPILWKIVRGDSGDCIPIGIKRFPKRYILDIISKKDFSCIDSFDEIIKALKDFNYEGSWKEKMRFLDDKHSDEYKILRMNYDLVCPVIFESLELSKYDCDNMSEIFSSYGIKEF